MRRVQPYGTASGTTYHNGDPLDGSVPDAAFFNLHNEELAYLVEQAGLPLSADDADPHQVAKAIVKLMQANAPILAAGAVGYFAMATAPAGWLVADGSAVSRTAYATLFSAIGTSFGAGDGNSTFTLPDLRGVSLRGFDGGRGLDPGRAFGSYQADALGSHSHGVNDPGHGHPLGDPGHSHGVGDPGHNHQTASQQGPGGGSGNSNSDGAGYLCNAIARNDGIAYTSRSGTGIGIAGSGTGLSIGGAGTGIAIAAAGAAETRGKNVALLACIKY